MSRESHLILSRAMRNQDFFALAKEGQVILDVHNAIRMWHPQQHKMRLWEYSLSQKVLKEFYGSRTGLRVCDIGSGCGYLSPILYWLGHDVVMYEIWAWGVDETFMLEQMRRVGAHRGALAGKYEVRHCGLGSMTEADRDFDAAFCVSTLEHIKDYKSAFRDLCGMVKPGGLLFATTDFGEHTQDDYQHAKLRAGKMFTKDTYEELRGIGESEGLHLFGKKDWNWTEECRLVFNYGFASLAMKKGTE